LQKSYTFLLLLLLLKSVELDDDVALLLSAAGLDMGPHVTSESEIGRTDSAALRTSWTCLRLCGSCTSFFRASGPAICEAPETSVTDSSPYISVACQNLQVTWLNVALEKICFDVVDEAFQDLSYKSLRTVAWQLARFQLTRRSGIARSLGDS